MTKALGYAHVTPTPTSRPARRLVEALALSAAAAALIATSSTTGMAAGNSASTVANVGVNAAIALTGLTPSFELDGAPGATVSLANAVTMNVVTNNIAGDAVTMLAEHDALVPANPVTNPDTIPFVNSDLYSVTLDDVATTL